MRRSGLQMGIAEKCFSGITFWGSQ